MLPFETSDLPQEEEEDIDARAVHVLEGRDQRAAIRGGDLELRADAPGVAAPPVSLASEKQRD